MLFNFLIEFNIRRLQTFKARLIVSAEICKLSSGDSVDFNPNVPLRPFTKAEFVDQGDKPITVNHFVAQVLIKSYENPIRTSEMNFQVRRSSKSAASNLFQAPSLRTFIKKKLE